MAENKPKGRLAVLDSTASHTFEVPSKRINEAHDVQSWLASWAYTDIMTFLLQLNAAMFPLKKGDGSFETWTLDVAVDLSDAAKRLQSLVGELAIMVQEAPPDTGPRRFGNASFRTWYKLVEERLDILLDKHLPEQLLSAGMSNEPPVVTAKEELKAYLFGSFGSPQRLDYGTGHELSFLAFLACLWKLGVFGTTSNQQNFGGEERQIVLGVIQPYLELVRKLITTYTLEPAGSHGVWGLDDHSFVPYVFGSAQLCPPISTPADITQEGSVPDAPRPSDVTKQFVVDRERRSNMYFAAIGFIYDVKKGPFWEHSPMLFDISGVTAGWAKINKGMIKMYNIEVLSKFPVVQHFPLGSLLSWERNPNAPKLPNPTHTSSQAQSRPLAMPQSVAPVGGRPVVSNSNSRVPSASIQAHRTTAMPGLASSWTGQSGATGMPATRAPWATARASPSQAPITSRTTGLPERSIGRSDPQGTSKPE